MKFSKSFYVNAVKVALNDEEIIQQTLSSQETDEGGRLVYKIIGLKKGDELTVTINCNKMGRKRETLVIE